MLEIRARRIQLSIHKSKTIWIIKIWSRIWSRNGHFHIWHLESKKIRNPGSKLGNQKNPHFILTKNELNERKQKSRRLNREPEVKKKDIALHTCRRQWSWSLKNCVHGGSGREGSNEVGCLFAEKISKGNSKTRIWLYYYSRRRKWKQKTHPPPSFPWLLFVFSVFYSS